VVQAAGIEEHLELEDRAPAPIVSGVESWIQGTGSEGEEPALVEAPTQQEIVWPKSLPLKVNEGKTAVEESTLETKE
jgi:hypothetical protein